MYEVGDSNTYKDFDWADDCSKNKMVRWNLRSSVLRIVAVGSSSLRLEKHALAG